MARSNSRVSVVANDENVKAQSVWWLMMRAFLIGGLALRRGAVNAVAVHPYRLIRVFFYTYIMAFAGAAAAEGPNLNSLPANPDMLRYRLEEPVWVSRHMQDRVSGISVDDAENSRIAGVGIFYEPLRFDAVRVVGALRIGATKADPLPVVPGLRSADIGPQSSRNTDITASEQQAESFAPSRVTMAAMVPDFAEAQSLSSYRVIWVAGVGIAVLLGGMLLCWFTRCPQWILGLVTGSRHGGAPVTDTPSEIGNPRTADRVKNTTNLRGQRSVQSGSIVVATKNAHDPAPSFAVTGQDESGGGSGSSTVEVPAYPVYDQCHNASIFEEDDWSYPVDELGNAIEQANLFCEFKQFHSARAVLEPLAGIDDVRLYGAIAKIEIQEIESKKLNRS